MPRADDVPHAGAGPGMSQRSILRPRTLHHGTMVSADLAAARVFYEEFLGLACTAIASDQLILRLPEPTAGGCVIEVHHVGSIDRPQNLLNHWGIDVPSRSDVDRICAAAGQHKERYGLRRVMTPRMQHGVYGFYLQDRDSNWWEIEYTDPARTHVSLIEAGDQYPD
ncbi:MAG TPA: VOC family protein [Vineibacter sp.]|nr:VOC family protein [Vineibacter sp.]